MRAYFDALSRIGGREATLATPLPFLDRRRVKHVNAVSRFAQRDYAAFAIVKVARRGDLGIIKTLGILLFQKNSKIKGMFAFKHIGKITKEQIFTGLLIIFTIL